jgi:hypothetical protein
MYGRGSSSPSVIVSLSLNWKVLANIWQLQLQSGVAAAGSRLRLTFGTWLTSFELERALVDFFSMLLGS